MEIAIGKVFEHEGKKFKVVEDNFNCENCFFDNGKNCTADDFLIKKCSDYYIEDEKAIIFKLLEE